MRGPLKPRVLWAIAGTILVWCTAYVGTRYALRAYSPMPLALLRFLVATGALGLYGWRKGFRGPRPKDVPLFLGLGFLGIFLYMWLFNLGHQTVTAATGSFLIALTPLFTALNASLFQGRKVSPRLWGGMSVSLAGVGLIAFGEHAGGSLNRGVVLLLAAAWLLALYNVLVKPLSERYDSLEITLYTFAGGTIPMLCFFPGLLRELPQAPWGETAAVVGLGLFPAALGYALWSYALSKAPAEKVATFMYVTPVLTMLLGFWTLGEWPHPSALLGGCLALMGVGLSHLKD